jgi:tRNA(adenine34) deaminase
MPLVDLELQFTPRKRMRTHEDYMQLCIEWARVAQQEGETPVGALIVRDGHVIAEAVESVKAHLDITAHAEIEAIRIACHSLESFDLSGCVLYTTAEPCWMCSYAIRRTGISEVFIGAPVQWVGGVTSAHPILSDPEIGRWPAPPAIVWSELRADCEALRQDHEADASGEGI